jgi:hypothetical protein
MTKFFVGSATATYESQGAEFFTNADDLQQTIRKLDHSCLEFNVIKEMMTKMCGGEGAAGSGLISEELTDERNIKKYLNYFPYFRTLCKMCHVGMTVRKEKNQMKKLASADNKKTTTSS